MVDSILSNKHVSTMRSPASTAGARTVSCCTSLLVEPCSSAPSAVVSGNSVRPPSPQPDATIPQASGAMSTSKSTFPAPANHGNGTATSDEQMAGASDHDGRDASPYTLPLEAMEHVIRFAGSGLEDLECCQGGHSGFTADYNNLERDAMTSLTPPSGWEESLSEVPIGQASVVDVQEWNENRVRGAVLSATKAPLTHDRG